MKEGPGCLEFEEIISIMCGKAAGRVVDKPGKVRTAVQTLMAEDCLKRKVVITILSDRISSYAIDAPDTFVKNVADLLMQPGGFQPKFINSLLIGKKAKLVITKPFLLRRALAALTKLETRITAASVMRQLKHTV